MAVAEHLAELVGRALGIGFDVVHRDIDRVNMKGLGADPDHADPPPRTLLGGKE